MWKFYMEIGNRQRGFSSTYEAKRQNEVLSILLLDEVMDISPVVMLMLTTLYVIMIIPYTIVLLLIPILGVIHPISSTLVQKNHYKTLR
jgi:hypothetical protein